MSVYEKNCSNCRYFNCEVDANPCVGCRNSYLPYTTDWNEFPFMWESDNDVVEDAVNHPPHYTQGGIECIDAMTAAFGKEAVQHFCICNAFKYIWRSEHKNGQEDLDKANWYINKYKQLKESV